MNHFRDQAFHEQEGEPFNAFGGYGVACDEDATNGLPD